MTKKPRAYTEKEVRKLFLQYVWQLVRYWQTQENTKDEAVEGIAFSILSTLDGSSVVLPAFAVIPTPHSDDRDYHIKEEQNFFPDFDSSKHCDIAGSLHEIFYSCQPEEE